MGKRIGRDNVGDILRGDSGVVEKRRTDNATERVVGGAHAIPVFGTSGLTPVDLSILPQLLCGHCVYLPLFLHWIQVGELINVLIQNHLWLNH